MICKTGITIPTIMKTSKKKSGRKASAEDGHKLFQ